jgi:hypothetical protein
LKKKVIDNRPRNKCSVNMKNNMDPEKRVIKRDAHIQKLSQHTIPRKKRHGTDCLDWYLVCICRRC